MSSNIDKNMAKIEISPQHTGMNFGQYGIYGEIYNPDSILRTKAADLDIYEIVTRDDQFKSAFTQRISGVISREYYVEPGGESDQDKAAANSMEANLRELNFDEITKFMMYGLVYGYSVAELIYDIRDNKIIISDIRVRDRARFKFHRDGSLLLKNNDTGLFNIKMPDNKFWVYRVGANHSDNFYGTGLAHWLYWPVFFKRGGMQSWLKFLDKYGTPTAMGTFQKNATDAEKTKLLEALRAINTDAGIIIPQGMQVELIEATRGGSATYAELYDRMDAAISKVVLTQTLTTQQGNTGSQALGRVHADMSQMVAKDDADTLCQSLNNSAVKWLTAWNFPGAIPPRIWRRMEDGPSKENQATLDKQLYDSGYRSTPERINLIYGEGYEPMVVPPPAVAVTPPASFSEGNTLADKINIAAQAQDDIASASIKLSQENTPIIKKRIDAIFAILDETKNFTEFSQRLAALAADDPSPEIVNALEDGALVSRMYGAKISDT